MLLRPRVLEKKIQALFHRAEAAFLGDEGRALDPDGARLALRVMIDDLVVVGAGERFERLLAADAAYAETYGVCGVRPLPLGSASRVYHLGRGTYALYEGDTRVLFGVIRDVAFEATVLRRVFGEETGGLVRYDGA